MKVRLPISDRARKRLFRLFFYLYVVLFVPMLVLNYSFYFTGSFAPDPTSGRIFPVNEHGVLYVVPWQGELANLLFWAAVLAFAAIAIVNPYRGRAFPLSEE